MQAALDYERVQTQRREEQRDRDYQQEREQRRRRISGAMCQADDWDEAWRQGITSYEEEARLEESLNANPEIKARAIKETRFFIDALPKLRRAREIFNSYMADANKEAAETPQERTGKRRGCYRSRRH